MKNFRFSFDLGTTSIGWAVFELDERTGKPVAFASVDKRNIPIKFSPMGVRVFEDGRDPQSKASNAAGRMGPRSARKGQDRRLARRTLLLSDLEEASLLAPKGAERDLLFALNPYELRARAAVQEVTLFEMGRALWHLSKHRGFKSNRKADKAEDDSGLIRPASMALQARLKQEGHATYGAFLWTRLLAGEGVRVRATGENADKHYEFYPTRDMLEAEFDAIWSEQARHHDLSDALRDRLRDYTIFYQRPLKPVEPGRCTFFPDKERLPKWHPAAQAFLIMQDLANLRVIRDIGEQSLDMEQRKVLFDTLNGGDRLTWNRVRRVLGLSSLERLNLEEGGLKHLHYNQVAANLLGTKRKPGSLSEFWPNYSTEQREELLGRLADSESPEELVTWLMAEHGLERSVAEAVERIHLPDKHLRFCREVTEALVTEMRNDVIDYSDAVERAPLLSDADVTHSDFRPDMGRDSLPRYNELEHLRRMLGNGTGNPDDPPDKRFGKITNPTVHIALGQFRRVMNMLIAEFGKPAEVVLEAARDLNKSPKEKDEIDKLIRANTKRNDGYREELEEAGLLKPGQRVGNLFLKMRLWEELGRNEADRRSPFSGRPISRADLFSNAVEIEHILPFAETFDDSPANKTLAFRDENQRKGKLSPGDAAERGIFDQERMINLTKQFPRNKAWRFLPDAMKVFEEQKSFDDRQLHATGYLARVVRAYAETLFDKTDDDGKRRNHVWMLPGRMTAMLRHRWGLNLGDHNRKNRDDHRHHAIDAAVIGVIDRAMIKRLQDAAKSVGTETLSRVLPAPPEPFDGYRDQVLNAVARINVSHRPKHFGVINGTNNNSQQTAGRLQNDGRYGLIRDHPENQEALMHAKKGMSAHVKRSDVAGLNLGQIRRVRDLKLRGELQAVAKQDGDLAANLADWSRETGIKRVRLIEPLSGLRPLFDGKGRPFTYLRRAEIAYLDILARPDGKWFAHDVDMWALYLPKERCWENKFPDCTFVMRLHKGDTIQLFDWDVASKGIVPESNRIKVIRKLNNSPTNKNVVLFALNEAGELEKRHKDDRDHFEWDWPPFDRLRLRRARRVRIDELGRVHTIPHGKV